MESLSRTKSKSSTTIITEQIDQTECSRSFRVIEELQSLGINVSDIKKLQEAGIVTVGGVLQCSSRDLISIKGFSESKVEKIKGNIQHNIAFISICFVTFKRRQRS